VCSCRSLQDHNHQLIPLSTEVGEVFAVHLRIISAKARVRWNVYVGAIAPCQPLSRCGLSWVVTGLARRAGIDGRVGAHRLHGNDPFLKSRTRPRPLLND
jgi:hypothetical protein